MNRKGGGHMGPGKQPGGGADRAARDAVKLIGVVDAGGAAAEMTAGVLRFTGKGAGLLRRGSGAHDNGPELREALRRLGEGGCQYAVVQLPADGRDLEKTQELPFFQMVFSDLPEDVPAFLFESSGVNILNMDLPGAQDALRAAGGRVYTYSAVSDAADLSARDIKLGSGGVSFCALMTGKLQKLKVGRPGMASVYGALAAAASAVNAGIGLEDVRVALDAGGGDTNTLGGTLL